MKNKKSKVETKKTKLNKVISINNKKMLKQNKTTKLLNEKNYIIFLKYTLPEQVTTAQSEE
jgi:CRISPR/Cas system-associated protein Cas5 (RAMP superfamily)